MRPDFSAVCTLVLTACASAPARAPSSDPPPPTRVVRFVPSVPPGPARDGTCWTASIAAPRAGAWRCKIDQGPGHPIVDPCFTPASSNDGHDSVVCAPNPAAGAPGFALHLVQPFPSDVVTPTTTATPWLLRLADGQVCTPITGTVPVVDGKEARWACGAPGSARGESGLLTRIDEGSSWTAEWYPASEGHSRAQPAPSTVPPTRVAVTDVWE